MDKMKTEHPSMSVDEMNEKLKCTMDDHGMTAMHNEVEEADIYGDYDKTNISAWATEATSLSHGRKKQEKLVQPKANFGHQQQQQCYSSAMSTAKVSKMMNRVNKKSKGSYY
eukprot:TRINITY_DN498_c0_g1_i1.p2 TRINITY_DN498_c0_g1~~TRINITY_DN498_c0_g1_i1.p2  ORF type:complete len:112 (-),score=37.51 TRINITY_DN498_c0_g1_i1:148-483(-)